MLIFHHGQNPVAQRVPLRPCFPFAADEPLLSVLPHARLVGQLPVVDVVATTVAAHVCDATFVIVAGGHAGVAVESGVVLTRVHELLQVGVLAGGRRGHAVIGVGSVGREGGRWVTGRYEQGSGGRRRRIVIFSEVVHGLTCESYFQCIPFSWPSI